MATSYAQSAGFNLPSIDYSLTKPTDWAGALSNGLALFDKFGDVPNNIRGKKIQADQQKKIMDGGLQPTEASVGADGMVTSKMKTPEEIELEHSLQRSKVDVAKAHEANLFNQAMNRDVMSGIAQQRVNYYGANTQDQMNKRLMPGQKVLPDGTVVTSTGTGDYFSGNVVLPAQQSAAPTESAPEDDVEYYED